MFDLLNRLRLWLRAVLFGRRLDREMREEVSAHLARSTDDWISRGLAPDEARAAARREFGHVESIHEAGRDARGVRGIESVVADLRYGVRHLRRTPVATFTMVIVMALGLGFSSAVFIALNSFFTSLPAGMTPQDRLVRIRGIDRESFRGRAIGREFSYPEYREYEAQTRLFSETAAWTSSDIVLDVGTREQNLQSGAATYVTSRYFQVLGLSPIAGAGLPDVRDDEPAPPLVGIISDALWARYYGRSMDAIGRTLKVNDVPVTIVGVAPRRFAGARTGGSRIRVWLPLATRPQLQRVDPIVTNHAAAIFGLLGRLAPGVAVDDTSATVRAIARQATQQSARRISLEAWSTDVVPLLADNYFPPPGVEDSGPGLGPYVTLVVPLLVLAITCTNVSALLAGRAVARQREVAVRIALGASRGRVVRQLVTESVLVAIAAGLLGLGVIWLLIRVFDVTIPDIHVGLDWPSALFTFALATLAGVIFGLAPALHATRVAVAETIKDAGGIVVTSRSRLQAGLVVAQIAFTQPALLAMGSLLLEVTGDYLRRPTSALADRVLDVRFNTNPRYGTLDDKREAALARVHAKLAGVPGVVAVVPQNFYDGYFFNATVHPDDRQANGEQWEFDVSPRGVSAEYFGVMDIPIVRGRNFRSDDSRDSGAIIIGADVARRLWGSADPIGRRVAARSDGGGSSLFIVVGVVDDTRSGASGSDREQRFYLPYTRGITSHFLIQTQGAALPIIPAIRAAANSAAPEQPLISVQTLAQIETASRTSIRRGMAAIGGSGLVALFLSAIGLYAVVWFAVGQRVREIGIRTALGANRMQVVNLFLFRGLRLTLGALVIGLTLSLIVVQLLAVSRGETVEPAMLWLSAIVALVVIAVALVASWIPARRAAMVDPLQALRTD